MKKNLMILSPRKFIAKVIVWSKRPKRYRYLFRAIRKIKPRNIMEIGTWNGNRAIRMIETAKKFYRPEQINYYGFDLFEEMTKDRFEEELSKFPPAQDEVLHKLKQTGVNIRLYKGDTLVTLPRAVDSLPKMDFIFIDGGHSVETIANDWNYAEQLMHKNSVVIFDDYYFDKDDVGAKAVVEKIDRSKFDVKILPIRDRFKKKWGVLSINFVRVNLLKK